MLKSIPKVESNMHLMHVCNCGGFVEITVVVEFMRD
jgi:hypothetical protein